MCGDVDCKECVLPKQEYRHLHTIWVCSVCLETAKAYPYWGSGECEICGTRSSILTLCEVK